MASTKLPTRKLITQPRLIENWPRPAKSAAIPTVSRYRKVSAATRP